jgi:alpha-L-rhamnosidase
VTTTIVSQQLTDHAPTPRGVGPDRPEFSWRIESDGVDVDQVASRIRVWGRPLGHPASGRAAVWDSGPIASSTSRGVRYDGDDLESFWVYDWEVEATLDDGSVVTGASWFETAVLAEGHWRDAAWIAASPVPPTGPSGATPVPRLSREFSIDREVAAARLVVTAGGYALGRINGRPVSDDVLSPAFTDYTDRVLWVVDDVTDLLAPGTNRIDLDLGRGFFGLTNPMIPEWAWNTALWHDEPRTRALLLVRYADGTEQVCVTDGDWECRRTATTYDDLFGGEHHDPRTVTDTATAAIVGDGPAGALHPQRHQPIRVTESFASTGITSPRPGTLVVAFPRVIAGWVAVTSTATTPVELTLTYGEKVDEAGMPNTTDGQTYFDDPFQQDEVVLEPGETWHPQFVYHGFRYVQIEGWPANAPHPELTAYSVATDVATTGSFACSDDLVTAIHDAVVRTMRLNLHGIPTDTPTYEKNGWLGDALVGTEMFLMNLDVHRLWLKWLDDIAQARDDDGRPVVIAPWSGRQRMFDPSLTWSSAYVLIPWWVYRYRGDVGVLRRHFAGISSYVDLEFAEADGGIATTKLNDWVSPDTPGGGGYSPDDPRVSATAFLYLMLRTLADIADVLGEADTAASARERADVVRDAFTREFYDAAVSHYRGVGDEGYRQTHNVLAVAFGLVSPSDVPAVVAGIVADIRARGTHLNTGSLGTKWLLPVLAEHGHADVAWELLTQTTFPSWGYWIVEGSLTTWEHWRLDSRSRGHYFLGTVDDWLFHGLLGLRAASAGFDTATVSPVFPDGLNWARGHVDTPHGRLGSSWERSGDRVDLTVEVPVGCRAIVELAGERSEFGSGVHRMTAQLPAAGEDR